MAVGSGIVNVGLDAEIGEIAVHFNFSKAS